MGPGDFPVLVFLAVYVGLAVHFLLSHTIHLFKGCKVDKCLSDECKFRQHCSKWSDEMTPERADRLEKMVEERIRQLKEREKLEEEEKENL